ncbi:MAG: VOC family protein [Candidatus Dadabacteria bacterium]|nr:VOC family protein [Candidatus Dadabacteria bacterium]NIS08996.1 VOC family protein [Candidatus Dadabacteria bacterium]NIV41038.1 VOC family protein [Candidatus Dadabacteria bacterium]NIX15598.1 VOC family protein [Candidatus Dadabacteria bacterium]NIY22339.1 VOC family protein [Candidatus Dadabacteria bacterium]
MPTDQKIDYVEFPAGDFDAVQEFYEKTFGWKFTDFGENYRAFTDGKLDSGFYKSDKFSSTETGAALIVIYATDLEKTQKNIIKNGGKIVKETFSFPGGRRFHFSDPNGNELAVWSDK